MCVGWLVCAHMCCHTFMGLSFSSITQSTMDIRDDARAMVYDFLFHTIYFRV